MWVRLESNLLFFKSLQFVREKIRLVNSRKSKPKDWLLGVGGSTAENSLRLAGSGLFLQALSTIQLQLSLSVKQLLLVDDDKEKLTREKNVISSSCAVISAIITWLLRNQRKNPLPFSNWFCAASERSPTLPRLPPVFFLVGPTWNAESLRSMVFLPSAVKSRNPSYFTCHLLFILLLIIYNIVFKGRSGEDSNKSRSSIGRV